MSVGQRVLRDAWVRGCLAVGAVMLGVATIVGLPWPLWLAWAYVVLLSAYDVARPTRLDT
ncbi:MAG: hypothetical protein JWN84_4272 [Nocardioides sp.]|nr:hypothetical protein [Nocardioides sp.]